MKTRNTTQTSLRRIESARKAGYDMEAFLLLYHLNLTLMRHLLAAHKLKLNGDDLKPKAFVKAFFKMRKNDSRLKGILNSRSAKIVHSWLKKSDEHFKALRTGVPLEAQSLLNEGVTVAGVLSMSGARRPASPAKASQGKR